MEINELLKLMVDKKASDMHLRVPSPPVLRIDGMLIPQDDLPPLAAKDIEMAFERITTPEQRSVFLKEKELDFAYSVAGLARFRVNIMRQRGTISIAFRLVPFDVLSVDELGLPQDFKELVLKKRGLILVTGPAGSGKSTTMAAIVHYLNQNESRNVITIEDPIEYLYSNDRCLIAQRDVGDDTRSFAVALKHALRHDPNVIVIGEMIDPDTISTALRAAEMGHLVLGVLDASDAVQAVDRIIEVFPQDRQRQARIQLSRVLQAVLCQRLALRISGGRVAAFEMLFADDTVKELIRGAEEIQSGSNGSLKSMDQALAGLVEKGIISADEALSNSSNPGQLQKILKPKPEKVKANK
jgi:twitching motility protein PilT